jgi:hypothetical protein
VLAGNVESADALKDRCVRTTARQRVQAILALEGVGHPPADQLVAHGLRQGPGRGSSEIDSHLPLCAACTEALRTIGSLQRAAKNWAPEEDVSDIPTDRPVRRRKRRSRPATGKHSWPSPWTAWPLFVVLGAFLWLGWTQRGGELSLRVDDRLPRLVDRTPPLAPPASSLPAGAKDAIRDLKRGDCHSASARLRTTRRKRPEHVALRLLEGAAFVCAGNGAEALDAVRPLEGQVAGGEVPWTLARAHLLLGQPEPARRHLAQVLRVDPALSGRARALLIRVAEVESGLQ